MTDFATLPAALPGLEPLDPAKHVNYTLGMVLGVDDFEQEFAYHAGRHRRLARELGGYGTVWGLDVTVEEQEEQEGGPRVNVSPGVAVTPCGQLVCVSPAQCAEIADWLERNEKQVRERRDAAPGEPLQLHVVLCYRECPTDDMPIPGEPCRTEETLAAPSRLKDDFRLELRLDAPPQPEEDSVRDFVAWMRALPIVESGGSTVEELVAALDEAAKTAVETLTAEPEEGEDREPIPVPFTLLGSPPAGLAIPAAELREHLRVAFRFWVTNLRDVLRGAVPGCDCGCEHPGSCGCGCEGSAGLPTDGCDEDALLLGSIPLPLAEGEDLRLADDGWETADETRRPYLLHTRMLQEWLLSAAAPSAGGGGGGPAPAPIDSVEGVSAEDAAAHWDAATRHLRLEIPWGVKDVELSTLAAGAPPKLEFDAATRVMKLFVGPGERGDRGEKGEKGDQGDPGPAGGGEAAPPFEIAAGRFRPNPDGIIEEDWAFGKLSAEGTEILGLYYLTFPEFSIDARYVITGTAIADLDDELYGVQLVHPDSEGLREVYQQLGVDAESGFFVRVMSSSNEPQPRPFVIHVHDYSRAS